MTYRSAALTDTGKVRHTNQDRFLNDQVLGLFGVADGVGGLPGGAEAAQCAIDTVRAAVMKAGSGNSVDLTAVIRDTNTTVLALGDTLSPHTGIATTLTFGVVREDTLFLAHVGDSRCYLLRGGILTGLTEDDSMENEVRRRRARGELVFLGEYQRNVLSQCIGQPETPIASLRRRPLRAGDRVLFASDGVTRVVRDRELTAQIANAKSPEDLVRSLVDEANRRGGLDNATAVTLFVDDAQ